MEKEIVFEELEQRYDDLVSDYKKYLEEETKLSKKTIRRYSHGPRLVCLSGLYGCPIEPCDLTSSDFSEAIEYFGVHKYFIRSINEAKDVIASFKHFAKFLLQTNTITEDVYNTIIEEIKENRNEWLKAVGIRLTEDRDIYYEMIMSE